MSIKNEKKRELGSISMSGMTTPLWGIDVHGTMSCDVQVSFQHGTVMPRCGSSVVFLTLDCDTAYKLGLRLADKAGEQRRSKSKFDGAGKEEKKVIRQAKVKKARSETPPGCDHVFMDSPSCAKCGWRP